MNLSTMNARLATGNNINTLLWIEFRKFLASTVQTMMAKCVILILAIIVFAPVQNALAATLRVPFKYSTIQAAINASHSGDIVAVAEGYYLESVTLKPGVEVKGAGADRTFLSFPTRTVTGADGATLSGFTIRSTKGDAAVYCQNVSPTIRDNVITGSVLGILVHSYGNGTVASPLIENNFIQGNRKGIQVSASQTYVGPNGVTAPIIRNNVITANAEGIVVGSSNGSTVVTPTIVNNTIADNTGKGIHLGLAYGQVMPKVLNNVLMGNGGCGVKRDDNRGVPVLGFNNVWSNAGGEYCGVAAGINDISVDPLFVHPGTDYHLSPGSPSIDAGNPSSEYDDVNFPPSQGTQRNDQGAYGGPATMVNDTASPPILSINPASLDFRNVAVGTSKNLEFTVKNTGAGTLTGTTTASLPFSIFSGGSFSLATGASQAVVVRFSPTASGTFTGNVSFTSNGGDMSRVMSGTGSTVSGNLKLYFSNDPDPHPFSIFYKYRERASEFVVADVNPSNITGTWFQVNVRFDVPSELAPRPVSLNDGKPIPFAFLVGPFSDKNFKSIQFNKGEYLQLDVTRTSIPAFGMLAIDMIGRGLFGVELKPIDLGNALVIDLFTKVTADCAGELAAFGTKIVDRKYTGAINRLAKFMLCTKTVKKEILQLVRILYGGENSVIYASTLSKNIASISLLLNATSVTELAVSTFDADIEGFIRLEARP